MMKTDKLTAPEIASRLSQFIGTENYWRHWTGALVYTDGVKAMAEMCGAFWLIDAIASWQPTCRRDEMLREMQFWILRRFDDQKWVLEVERDEGDVAFHQEIEFSDFPLREIKLWVQAGSPMVLMLPSEY
ncbi:hypothetical protein LLG95_05465 [bacterium]|nr:hypothetical protein [bacterium]